MDHQKSISDLEYARQVLTIEAQCILAAKEKLGESFSGAVQTLESCIKQGGKLVVTGVGKSGKIAAKVAATFSSIGAAAVYLHPTEGAHGDLGLVTSRDCVLAFSNSGSTVEILAILPRIQAKGAKIISVLGNLQGPLAKLSDFNIDGSVAKEACPLNLAPTSSTTVALALGDALAMSLALRLDYKEESFAENHPGGQIGKRLTLKVASLMQDKDLPWVKEDATVPEILKTSTEKKLGAVLVSGPEFGIITDGDIRRALAQGEIFFKLLAKDIMTTKPISIAENERVVRALELMENRTSQISILPVTQAGTGKVIGLLRLHDIIGKV